ncbi:hypothetical protein NC651_009495, partial [Populus alba x Populus x berolinensis]
VRSLISDSICGKTTEDNGLDLHARAEPKKHSQIQSLTGGGVPFLRGSSPQEQGRCLDSTCFHIR